MPGTLVIKIAVGGDAERLQTALTVAATAAASAVDVSLWLAGDAAWLGVTPDRAPGPADAETEELFDAAMQSASVTVCARCAERRGITADDLRAGIRIRGAAAFVSEIVAPGAQALVY